MNHDLIKRARAAAPHAANGAFINELAYALELLSASKPAAPMGWKLVPVEPTPDMLDQWIPDPEADPPMTLCKYSEAALREIYRAMLAASPAAPAQSGEPVAEVPEGCTVADATMLREANHGLAAENDRLKQALGPFARLVSTDKLSWAMVEYCVESDPEKQTFQRPQMQRAFNRAAEVYRNAAPLPTQPAAGGEAKPIGYAKQSQIDAISERGSALLYSVACPDEDWDVPVYLAAPQPAQTEQSAETRSPLMQWQDGAGLLWDVYSHGKWIKRIISPIKWDAHAVYLAMMDARYAPHIDIRLVSSTNNASPDAPMLDDEPVSWECASPIGEKPALAFLTSKKPTLEHYESQGWRVTKLYTASSISYLAANLLAERAARAASPQPVAQTELRRIAHELRTYTPAADECKGGHIHKVWAREIDALLAAQPASGDQS